MKLGIFAKTFSGDAPSTVLGAARRAGYDAVQYNMACSGLPSLPEWIEPAVADAVRAASEANGVVIAAVSATYNMIDPDTARRERGRRAFAAVAGAARRMGAGLVTVCTGSRDAEDQWRHHPENDGPQAWREMCAEFERILPIADTADVDIGVEPELGNVVSSTAKARRAIEELQSPRLRIVLDPANLFEVAPAQARKDLIEAAVDALAERIALAHAKDRSADGGFAAAGDGVVDFEDFFRTLARAGFDGPVVTHGLAETDAARVGVFLRGAMARAEAGR